MKGLPTYTHTAALRIYAFKIELVVTLVSVLKLSKIFISSIIYFGIERSIEFHVPYMKYSLSFAI